MARVVKALGVKEVEKISKMPGVHAVGGVPGLALRVWASVAGSGCAWILRTECKGKETKLTVGTYPEMGLHAARERQKFCVHGIIGARQSGASNEHEYQTQFS